MYVPTLVTSALAQAPPGRPEIFLEWKEEKEVRKVWPTERWWGWWNAATCPRRTMSDEKAIKDCQLLLFAFALGALWELKVGISGIMWFVAAGRGLGLHQLKPSHWDILRGALEGFFRRAGEHWKDLDHARIEAAREKRGLTRREAAADWDAFLERRAAEGEQSKGWLWIFDDELPKAAIEMLLEKADDECIDSDAAEGDTAEGDSDEPEGVLETVVALRSQAQELQEKARDMLEKADKLEREYIAGAGAVTE